MSWLRGEGAGGSYRRKDYSQRVRFPVEILDRSGEAHHYGFISAVHIYQTRARSVSHRCTDRRDAQAEWLHCRRRIEQLRHSYLESLPPQLLAILQREAEALGGRRAELGHLLLPLLRELPLVELTPLSSSRPGERSFRLQLGEDRLLLRGYDLEPYGDEGARRALAERLRDLSMGRGMDAERLVQLRVDDEGAWVLTGRQLPPGTEPLRAERLEETIRQRLLWRSPESLRTELLDEIQEELKAAPQLPSTYARILPLAARIRAWDALAQATTLARIYIPKEPRLAYYESLCLLVRGDELAALRVLSEEQSLQRAPESQLRAVLLTRRGRRWAALKTLRSCPRLHPSLHRLQLALAKSQLLAWMLLSCAAISGLLSLSPWLLGGLLCLSVGGILALRWDTRRLGRRLDMGPLDHPKLSPYEEER